MTKVMHPGFEYTLVFDKVGFALEPVKGDLSTGYRIVRNSREILIGAGTDRPGNKRLELDKRRHTIKIVSIRTDGSTAYTETGSCFGP